MRRVAAAIAVAWIALSTLPTVPAAPDPEAPAATATFASTPDRLAPLGRPEAAPMTVTYDCSRQHPTEATRITFEVVDRPDWLTATANVSAIVDRVDRTTCAEKDHRRTVPVTWRLAADRGAPARRPANLTVEASVELADGAHTAQATVPVEAAFYDVLSRQGPTRVQAAAGETAELALTVRNRGNGPVRIQLEARDVDAGLEIDLPDAGAAAAAWQDGRPTWNGTIELAGADAGAAYGADVAIVPRYAEDPQVAGETLTHRVILETDALPGGATQGSPATSVVAIPAFTLAFAATLGLGVWITRREA